MIKTTVGIGQTKLRLIGVEQFDEVVQGVFTAKAVLGGSFPPHIISITVRDEELIRDHKKPWIYTDAFCESIDGSSRIVVLRRSIAKTATNIFNLRGEACRAVLHEVDHANYSAEEHMGAWLDHTLTRREAEERAERFKDDVFL